jgi:hypothetical protein
MSESILAAQIRAKIFVDDMTAGVRNFLASEKGQGAAEYAGLIAIVAILVLAIAGAVKNVDLGSKVESKLNEILNAGGGGGGGFKLPFGLGGK